MAAAKAKAAAAGEPAPMTPAEKAKAAAMADPELARKIAEAKAKAAAIKAAREKGEAYS